jgi:hypothetical protein
MAVWHPAISGQFRNVVDLDPFACVVLRIRGDAAVRYLMLLDPGEHGERCIVHSACFACPDRYGGYLLSVANRRC